MTVFCTCPLDDFILCADQSVHVCVPGEDQGGTQGEGSQGEERGEGGGEG